MNIDEILLKQKAFFSTGKTLSIDYRIQLLKKLYSTIQTYEKEIQEALYLDLAKSANESYMCEIGLSLSEISYMIKHLPQFSKERKVKTPLSQFCAKSYTKPVPYGNVLIMSPWNYPFLLTIDPLVDALAAGNTVILKPSAYSPNTSAIILKIVQACFDEEVVAVVTGGRKENTELLNQKFDFIFFTGSQAVGKVVLHHAAEYLTPVVLELGGKSPCIIDRSANIDLSAKRIVFGKFLNCGQTCVAPDYILCPKELQEKLVEALKKQIIQQYSDNPLQNKDYGKIINLHHFERLNQLIDKEKVVIGGESDEAMLKIAPTVMQGVNWNDKVMQEEIFGPILPILTYDNLEEIIEMNASKPKPLALYLFSEDKKNIKMMTERCQYGGGCINDCIIHLATSEMGFGGVNESGMGAYHGKEGFLAFSHVKSIVHKMNWIDLPMRYQPYTKWNEKLIRFFLK